MVPTELDNEMFFKLNAYGRKETWERHGTFYYKQTLKEIEPDSCCCLWQSAEGITQSVVADYAYAVYCQGGRLTECPLQDCLPNRFLVPSGLSIC